MSTRTDSLFPYTTRFRSPVDAPVRDVSIEGDRRDIITAAEIIFERRIEAVRLLRPEVGVAARSRILDRVDVGEDIAETGVEMAKARPRKRHRIIEARLETAAELDARAGVGQKVRSEEHTSELQ